MDRGAATSPAVDPAATPAAARVPRLGSVRARHFGPAGVVLFDVWEDGEVLTSHPAARLRAVDWDRVQVGVVFVFHAWLAITLMFAPDSQVFTPGALPALELFPRQVWAVWFAVAALASAFLFDRVTVLRQIVTWLMVIPLSFAWIGSLAIAVLIDGRGSAIAAVVWPTLLIMWAVTAVRIALHTE